MRRRRYGERWYGPKAVVAATKDACESAIAAGVVAKAHWTDVGEATRRT